MAADGENGMEVVDGDDNDNDMTYEEIMGMSDDVSSSAAGSSRSSKAAQNPEGPGADSLSSRLVLFRRWLTDEAGCVVHPSLCIVNGDATDGTKNAPVLTFGPPTPSSLLGPSEGGPSGGNGATGAQSESGGVNGRCGLVDRDVDRALYDRTMGCQVRAARELKKDEVVLKVPRAAMISPDLVAASDAGRAVLACCEPLSHEAGQGEKAEEPNFWDAFGHTATMEKNYMSSLGRCNGTQTLVKILQERKRAVRAIEDAEAKLRTLGSNGVKGTDTGAYELTESGHLSARAPVLVFLLQQRFANSIRPRVAASVDPISEASGEAKRNAAESVKRTELPPNAPPTFGPYARTLPPTVHLPVCWKREELALLAGCIPGLNQLQEVAARTMQLASDLIALVESGIINRFPKLFPPGTFTWDRWVWAASVYTSRALPVSAWLNKGEESAANHVHRDGEWFYSPPHVWDELGVLIPLLDMINHESESNQITWVSPPSPTKAAEGDDEKDEDEEMKEDPVKDGEDVPCAVLHKRVKKTGQIYLDYGKKSNEELISHYGFAQINNFSDDVRMGWGLADAVGDVPAPSDYTPQTLEKGPSAEDDKMEDSSLLVFESADNLAFNGWWTESRLQILSSETNIRDNQLNSLKGGKKLMAVASNDGSYDPILLAAVVVATMPKDAVRRYDRRRDAVADDGTKEGLKLTMTHQRILRHYLAFIYSRKLERLLQTLNNGLGAHFNSVQLWTKLTEGGLQYDGDVGGNESNASHVGWQSFFDSHAYGASMEVEKRYYALGPDSCVLTLYDGNLRALQTSLDGILSWGSFEKGVLSQLGDLGFVLLDNDDLGPLEEEAIEETKTAMKQEALPDTEVSTDGPKNEDSKVNGQAGTNRSSGDVSGGGVMKSEGESAKSTEEPGKPGQDPPKQGESQERRGSNGGGGNDGGSDRCRNRRNRRNRGDRPPAIKLHIGNLSYDTRPCDLYEYFTGLYGRENVLECHIPMERETGRSRGFGFVTMPEETAIQVLRSGRPHEIEGRPLKVAESNTAGSGKNNRSAPSSSSTVGNADRCSNCGYRPKWCTCAVPNIPGFNGPNRPAMGDAYGQPGGEPRDHGQYNRMNRGPHNGDDRRGRRRRSSSDGWDEGPRWRSDSRSPSPRGAYKRFRDDRYSDHRDGWRSDRYMYADGYSRSPSPNHNRSRRRGDEREGRDRDRERDPDRERRAGERHRSGGRSERSTSGEWGSRSGRYANRSWSRSRSRSRSRSPERGRKAHHSKGGSSTRRNEDRDGMGPPGGKESEGATERRRERSRSPSSPYSDEAAHEPEKKRDSKSRPHGEGKSRERSSRRKRSSRSSHRKDGSKRHRSHSRDRSSPSRSWSMD